MICIWLPLWIRGTLEVSETWRQTICLCWRTSSRKDRWGLVIIIDRLFMTRLLDRSLVSSVLTNVSCLSWWFRKSSFSSTTFRPANWGPTCTTSRRTTTCTFTSPSWATRRLAAVWTAPTCWPTSSKTCILIPNITSRGHCTSPWAKTTDCCTSSKRPGGFDLRGSASGLIFFLKKKIGFQGYLFLIYKKMVQDTGVRHHGN